MSSSERKKIIWDEKMTEMYIKICAEEVRSGNRPTTHLNKKGWGNLQDKIKAQSNKDLDTKQLKNKWDNLKKDWQIWKRLLGKETGLGWNHDKRTIEAPEAWWLAKLKEIPNAVKFREKGLILPDEMELLFGDVAATGHHAWTPSSGTLPVEPTMDMYLEGSGDSDDSPPTAPHTDASAQMSAAMSKGKGKRVQSSTSRKHGRKRQSPTISVQASLEKLSEVVEKVQEKTDSGIEGCISVLDSLNIKDDPVFYCDCLCLLANKKEAREVLLCLKDPITQISFLKQMVTERKK